MLFDIAAAGAAESTGHIARSGQSSAGAAAGLEQKPWDYRLRLSELHRCYDRCGSQAESRNSAILMCSMARAGLNPLGQTSVQFMMVRQR